MDNFSILKQIGNTPLIRLKQASELTECNIYGKGEYFNPGESVKDRAALFIIEDAIKNKKIQKGGIVVEGTAGNTGIGLAIVTKAYGLSLKIVIPRTQSIEKKQILRRLGAELIEVDAVPYANPNNYIKQSKKIADEQVEKSNMRRKLNSKFKSNMGRSQEKEKLEEERRLFLLNTKEPAGKTSGACQRYGAESGDAPSWLKTTSHSSRSEDQLRTYLGTHPVHTQCSIPKSYRSDPSMQHGSSWENQKVEKNKTFASALRSTLKKEAIEEYEEHSDHSLWRPIGNRCIKSGITEEDHICLDRNPKMFTNVRVDSLLQNRRR